jgi:hypothetical protein
MIPFLCLNAILIFACNAGDIPDNVGCPLVPPSNVDHMCRASNSVNVQTANEEEPYGIARAIDSDDDYPIAALSKQDMELIRPFFVLIVIQWFMNSMISVILKMLMQKR